jgi:plastocyanin
VKRIVISLIAAIAVAATMVVSVQAGPAATVLRGEVNDNFVIKLTKNGVRVKTLKARTYQLLINDKSSSHNFIGKKTWTVKLKVGRYTIQCDPHATSGMRSTFKVTA